MSECEAREKARQSDETWSHLGCENVSENGSRWQNCLKEIKEIKEIKDKNNSFLLYYNARFR